MNHATPPKKSREDDFADIKEDQRGHEETKIQIPTSEGIDDKPGNKRKLIVPIIGVLCVICVVLIILVAVAYSDNNKLRQVAKENSSVIPPDKDISNASCRKPLSSFQVRLSPEKMIDLTHDFDENSAYWPNNPSGFNLTTVFEGFVNDPIRFFYSTKKYSQPEHLGTHMDAPYHFAPGKHTASQVPLSSLVGPGVLINLTENGERFDPDSLVSVDRFLQWERANEGRIRSGSIVLLYTGYGDIYDDRAAYFGTNLTGPGAVPHLHFPGLSPDAARWLITQRCIAAIGIDTASIDYAQSKDFQTHQILHEANIPNFENLANLKQLGLSGTTFNVMALPQKIAEGTGAPVRVVAMLGD